MNTITKLSIVALALLIVPRRSSKYADTAGQDSNGDKTFNKVSNKAFERASKGVQHNR